MCNRPDYSSGGINSRKARTASNRSVGKSIPPSSSKPRMVYSVLPSLIFLRGIVKQIIRSKKQPKQLKTLKLQPNTNKSYNQTPINHTTKKPSKITFKNPYQYNTRQHPNVEFFSQIRRFLGVDPTEFCLPIFPREVLEVFRHYLGRIWLGIECIIHHIAK